MAQITKLGKTAKKLGLKKGDKIKSIGGYPFCDVLDLIFFDSQDSFTIEIERKGDKKIFQIEKDEFDTLGIETDRELEIKRCQNCCKFCFIDQLPKGLRKQLYFKDDDYRFSFISGNYITLTNITDDEIERIIRLRLSPIYVSVHAFDDSVREYLVGNPATKKLIDKMRHLSDNNIKMHTQIVVVPNVNDKDVLDKTIRELHGISNVESVAVVPVGLTAHRDKLEKISLAKKADAQSTIALVEKLNSEFGGFCYCADEYYIKAGLKLPDYDYYGSFPQIENGVGLVATFEHNLFQSLSEAKKIAHKKVAMVTGEAFAPLLRRYAQKIEIALGAKIEVFAIKNNFFGGGVDVAGLVVATDIAKGVQTKCENILIPSNMLKEFSNVFLDDISVEQLAKMMGKKIVVVSEDGSDLVQKIISIK